MRILWLCLFLLSNMMAYGQIVMLKAKPLFPKQEHQLHFKVVEKGFKASSLEIKADDAQIAQPLQLSEDGEDAWLSVIPNSGANTIKLHLWREGQLLKSYTVNVLNFSLDLLVNGEVISEETTFSLQDSINGLTISERFMSGEEEDNSLKVYKWEVLLAANKRMLAIFKGDHQNLKEVSLTNLLNKATAGNRIVIVVESVALVNTETISGVPSSTIPLQRVWTIGLED